MGLTIFYDIACPYDNQSDGAAAPTIPCIFGIDLEAGDSNVFRFRFIGSGVVQCLGNAEDVLSAITSKQYISS